MLYPAELRAHCLTVLRLCASSLRNLNISKPLCKPPDAPDFNFFLDFAKNRESRRNLGFGDWPGLFYAAPYPRVAHQGEAPAGSGRQFKVDQYFMAARLQIIFAPKPLALFCLGATFLALGGCSGHAGWPNLASVPPRAEAYRLTPTPAKVHDKASPDQTAGPQEVKVALDNIRGEVRDMRGTFAEARASIVTEQAAYEQAVRKLSPTGGNLAAGNDSLVTVQLYLSRLSRTRDNLRNMNEKIEIRERDLMGLKAKITDLKSEELAIEAGNVSQDLGELSSDVGAEAGSANSYVLGELARLKILSSDTAGEAADASPAKVETAPTLTFPAGVEDAALTAGLTQMLAGAAPASPLQLRVAGGDNALVGRNQALIRVMKALLDKGVALTRISLAVERVDAASPVEIRLYVQSR
jgi:hypothetical protein